MKKYLLLSITLLGFSFASSAQENNDKQKNNDVINVKPDTNKTNKEVVSDGFNKWSVEFDVGDAKGARPYGVGYYSGNPKKFLGGEQVNHFGLGGRYMLSPIFGVKTYFAYNDLKNLKDNGSKPFETQHLQMTLEGVLNLMRLFQLQQVGGRLGLLSHLGIQASKTSPKSGSNIGKSELDGGAILGITPQFRIFNNVSIFADFSLLLNIRQQFNWDGSYSDGFNNLIGSLYTGSLGVSVALGKQKTHGDWAVVQDPKSKEIEELSGRVGEIETLMNDTDKDGVPDYLDAEPNSITGVAVDTKGRMVDKNNNGVPDQLEKYVDNSITTNNNNAAAATNNNAIIQLINEGYIAAYFDSGSSQPNISSANNIGFILNYLKNNPDKSVEISGYADETGRSETNNKLAKERAQNVKIILEKAGIDSSRLTIINRGIDKSVDVNSDYARRLVRKTLFKIK